MLEGKDDMYHYYAIYKPFGMLSQFSKEGEHTTLANIKYDFPKDVYPVGRLDADSEGLLILTNDKRINSMLLDPDKKHDRKYIVQVEGEIKEDALKQLESGIRMNEKGKVYVTLPAKAGIISSPELPVRIPPVRFRKNIPTSWIEIVLHEGKNRQVRKMTAAVGFPALRLVRMEIENLRLSNYENGWVEEINKNDFYRLLKLK